MSNFEKKEQNLNHLIDKLNSISLSYSQPNNELEKITRRYTFELFSRNSLGPNTYVPSTDYGTTSREMNWIYSTFKTLSNSNIDSAASVTSKSVTQEGVNGRTEATGRGVYIGVRELMDSKEEMKSIGLKPGIKGKKVKLVAEFMSDITLSRLVLLQSVAVS